MADWSKAKDLNNRLCCMFLNCKSRYVPDMDEFSEFIRNGRFQMR